MPAPQPRLPNGQLLLLGLALFVLVGLSAYACALFPRSQGHIAPIWLANAWLVAALLRASVARWPALAGLALIGNVLGVALAGDPPGFAVGIGLCRLAEALFCAWLMRARRGMELDIGRGLATFGTAAVAGSALSAGLAVVFLGVGNGADLARTLLAHIETDALGLLTLCPLLLVLTQRTPAWKPIPWRETWTLAVLAAVTVKVFFLSQYPMLFLIFAALMLPTWRMGLPGAVAGIAIAGGIGTAAVFVGHGPIMLALPSDRVLGLQLFLIVAFLTSVPVAVARAGGEELQKRLTTALKEARAARAEAEQAAQVKTEFLANMSHELRTPLTSVVGFTRLALEQPDLTSLTRSYINRVGEASRALLCAVKDILDFSKLEAGQVSFRAEPTDLAALARTTLDFFTPQAAAKDLALLLEDNTPAGLILQIDPDRLRQVLLNLVSNAVKFTAAGGVTLRTSYDEAGERLSIDVLDTGPGIPADKIDLLFKRFSQVDGSLTRGHGGTGLGLAICKGIVEAMGGRIGAESIVGQGSCFTLTVPAQRARAVAAEPAPVEAEPSAHTGVRVLVADDHPANRELAKLFLAAVDADVSEAGDGEAAVGLALTRPFDVILMDLRMPKLGGVEAVARIRDRAGPNRQTPILAFTADAESAAHGAALAGFDGAVAKPIDPSQLIAAISAALTAAGPGRELDLRAG